MRRTRTPWFIALALAGALVAGACSSADGSDGADGGGDAADEQGEVLDLEGAGTAELDVQPAVEALAVTGAEPGTTVRLVDGDDRVVSASLPPDGAEMAEGTVDDAGNLVFGRLEPGEVRLVVGEGEGAEVDVTEPIAVLAPDDHPEQGFYDDQELTEGLNYIEMRDGTTLAATVRFPVFPRDDVPAGGPYPTVVEMSGYDPANPSEPEPASQIASALGYATVGINLRGTGCSGGPLSYFEEAQIVDGYDAIEAVAAQDWVAGDQVGMVGLSYPGISQLYVASTQPPSLSSIAPQSVIDDVYESVLYPGGIYNDGFAREWSAQVRADAEEAAEPWVQEQIDQGDEQCEANQLLRSQNLDLVEAGRAVPFDSPERYGPLSPLERVDDIEVPVFLTGQWQDEQTGGHFATFLDSFGTDELHATLTNGPHGEGLTIPEIQRLSEFLDLYVAERVPELPEAAKAAAPALLNAVFGEGVGFGPDRFADADSYEDALAEYEDEDPIRVVFDNGNGSDNAGGPGGTFETTFASWPPPEAEATTWFLEADGTLSDDEPEVGEGEDGAAVEYDQDPDQSHDVTLPGDSVNDAFAAQPDYDWPGPEEGAALSFLTEPLDDDTVVVGSGRVDLWLQSTAADTDVEVTLTEVRPDGSEVYVQSGWLRASHRALDDEASTELRPVATHLEEDAEPLPEGEWSEVSVEVFPFAHTFREGSQIRLLVDSPGGSRARWAFDTIEAEGEVNQVGVSFDQPSSVTLGVVDGVDVADDVPPCGWLRAQPCRDVEEIDNRPADG